MKLAPKVAVVGGGIGGLGAALSLFRAGFDVHVYEQAHALRAVGAGIQVGPNASRVLHGLGLAEKLAKLGVRPGAHHQRRWDNGRTLLKAPLGDTVIKAFGFPHYQSHRADLLSMLIDALPAERLYLGHRLVTVTDRGDRVEVMFENGERITTDALYWCRRNTFVSARTVVRPGKPALYWLRGLSGTNTRGAHQTPQC